MAGVYAGVALDPAVDGQFARDSMVAYIEQREGCLRPEVEEPIDLTPLRAWPEADLVMHYERKIDGRERIALMLSALTGLPLWFSHYDTRVDRQKKIEVFLNRARDAPILPRR